MNSRAYIWLGGVIVGILILTKTPLVFSLFALFVLGIVPGTTVSVPAWVPLLVNPLLIIAILFWLQTHPVIPNDFKGKPLPRSKAVAKKQPRTRARTAQKRTATKRPSSATV